MMANTRMTVAAPISRLPISSLFLPRRKLMTVRTAMAQRGGLDAAPVDPGDAPTHIRKLVRNRVG
jgi:hypothetical protein